MKNKMSKFAGIFVPIILCGALILTGFLSNRSINELQGNARVINYTAIVRGGIQRLIKKELNNEPDDKLIEHLDEILAGLSNGSEELNLIKLGSSEFQALLVEMEGDWAAIKEEIYRYREDSSNEKLYELSENYFGVADEAVGTAENYTERIVQATMNLLIIMNIVFVVIAVGSTILALYQEKRRSRLAEIESENMRKSEQLSRRIQGLLAPMNEISELLYVADIDTYELLFVNEAGKKTFNISDDHQGMKCYKALQGLDAPCPFCTNSYLKPDETYSWEYTNPFIKKHYLLKDRLTEWEGRTARMEIAFDITKANEEKKELKTRLERENVLVDCIRELYRNHNVSLAFPDVLEKIGELFSAERVYIFLLHGDKISNIAEWCREGIPSEKDRLQELPRSEYGAWFSMLDKQENIVIEDVEEIKDTMPREYERLSMRKIHNVLITPLERDGKLSGFIGIDNIAAAISENVFLFLQTLQYFIMLSMERSENERMLYKLSYTDKLTSFYNRNRYIQDISELEKREESVGVVYLDLNGLKEINDGFGHDAGDKMLQKCAAVIQDSFHSGNLYRIGGDEFVIICTGFGREAFYRNVEELKNNFEAGGCEMAIGFRWEENCKNIQDIIKKADELMYNDKKRFYREHQVTNRYRHNNEQ